MSRQEYRLVPPQLPPTNDDIALSFEYLDSIKYLRSASVHLNLSKIM
jgi:hypothetical protein